MNEKELVLDQVEQSVVDVFFEDVMLDMVAESKPLTRKELYIKLEELRTKLSEIFGVEE